MHHGIFFGRHRESIGVFVSFTRDLFDTPVAVIALTLLNKIRIFSKTSRIHDHGNVVTLGNLIHGF
ncbi:Uncharacterised protein [Vibrio cholerae]|nr:Uncharacterised protein [Vibrio cholerae]